MHTLIRNLTLIALYVALLVAPGALEAGQKFDDLNGLWIVTLDGEEQDEPALTESFPQLDGVRMRIDGKVHKLTRIEDTLYIGKKDTVGIVGALNDEESEDEEQIDAELEICGLDTKTPWDDRLKGTFFGQKAIFKRDLRKKRPINIRLPGDRPWVRFMEEILIPKTAEDRESYHRFNSGYGGWFLRSCQLYKSGYWLYKYMDGETRAEQKKTFEKLIRGMDGTYVSARKILSTKFSWLLGKSLSEDAKPEAGLAASSLGMYFSTAAGGAVRIWVTDNSDSVIYYITDRRRGSKMGLVVMDTPTHAPLATTFGKWHLDFSEMPLEDDEPMTRAILETVAKSSSEAANDLSPVGRSAYTDYLGVMAIEDQRGAMFQNYGLSWGYNMTNACFATLISRALSHGEYRTGPEQLGSERELAMQVIVEGGWLSDEPPTLQPGNASYWDVLNGAENVLEGGKRGGNDMQERAGMKTLKKLTSDWLREKHPDLVKAVEDSFEGIVPEEELSSKAKEEIFHFMCENFYSYEHAQNITPDQATEIVDAGMALMKAVRENSRDLEEYILNNGVTKKSDWAPRASGY